MTDLYILLKFLGVLFVSRQGLICLFSFLSLVFVSHARKRYKDGIMKEMVDNLVALSFVTYLFTFFNILIKGNYMKLEYFTGEFILNAFIILILIVIIKTTVDIREYSKKKTNPKRRKKR